jgi:hypothetical protein
VIYLLAFAIFALAFVSALALMVMREANDNLHAQMEIQADVNRKDRQSLTNSLLRDLNKPVFPDAPMQVKPTQQWFAGKTVLVSPSPPSDEQQ